MLRRAIPIALLALSVPHISLSQSIAPGDKVYTIEELPPEVRKVAIQFLSHRKQITGAANPMAFSLADLMRGRLDILAKAPSINLSHADVATLTEYAAHENGWLNSLHSEVKGSLQSLCAQRHAMAPSLIGKQVTAIQLAEEQRMNVRYRDVLSSLSPQGRASVLKYLRSDVAPHMNKWTLDYASLSAEMPDQLIAQIELTCSGRSGEPTHNKVGGGAGDDRADFEAFGR